MSTVAFLILYVTSFMIYSIIYRLKKCIEASSKQLQKFTVEMKTLRKTLILRADQLSPILATKFFSNGLSWFLPCLGRHGACSSI